MRCFSCINTARKRLNVGDEGPANNTTSPSLSHSSGKKNVEVCMDDKQMKKNSNFAHSFPLQELVVATNNFTVSHLIGEGGFGKVFKGFLHNGQAIAVKQLNLEGLQGNQEFIIEVFMLSLLHHPNLVTLIGYCAEGNQKLLVYEYMPKGSLADHLFDKKREKEVVDWNTRIKIATGAARGLEHLHCEAKPAVIYRDLKSANILLDDEYNPRLSDFGLAKLGPVGDNTHVTTRVMGTYGYCAPEYVLTGKLTLKSDIFSFGVVLLEIITGKRALDFAKRRGQHNLVAWARLMLKDRRNCTNLVDPKLGGQFPIRSARRMIAIAGMCLNEDPGQRPPVKDIVAALEFLASEPQSPYATATYNSTGSSNHFQSQRMYSQTNRIGRLVRPINQDLGFAPVCKYRSRISQY